MLIRECCIAGCRKMVLESRIHSYCESHYGAAPDANPKVSSPSTKLPELKKIVADIVHASSRTPDPSPVRVPKRRGDVGFDLCAATSFNCSPGMSWIPTGVAIQATYPLWYVITGRSSLHKKGLFCATGVIDAGYQGELLVAVINPSQQNILIEAGEYIAQCVFFDAVVQPELRPVTEFEKTERGASGFGSTDR
jgi:dUTP pyrophosphatase